MLPEGVFVMWSVILQILAVLGILLLAVLGLVLILVLLVLFFPISYRAYGKKDGGDLAGQVRACWLFGILRVKGGYPQPGKITVKLLWFSLYDSGREKRGTQKKQQEKDRKKKAEADRSEPEGRQGSPDTAREPTQGSPAVTPGPDSKGTVQTVPAAVTPDGPGTTQADGSGQQTEGQKTGSTEEATGILAKFTKIKYTFRNIYDKIKEIWENISYYVELLQDEATSQCLSLIGRHAGKILRNMRPRKCRADIVFGTGSPDTTGYLYGAFCMVSQGLGKHVVLTPDFTGAILAGQAEIAGHIILAVLLWNGLRLFLDEELRAWIKKWKKGRK